VPHVPIHFSSAVDVSLGRALLWHTAKMSSRPATVVGRAIERRQESGRFDAEVFREQGLSDIIKYFPYLLKRFK
jgi:hypothetical protein